MIKSHKDSTKKITELINSVKLPDIKSTYEKQLHLYTLTVNFLKKKLRKKSHL